MINYSRVLSLAGILIMLVGLLSSNGRGAFAQSSSTGISDDEHLLIPANRAATQFREPISGGAPVCEAERCSGVSPEPTQQLQQLDGVRNRTRGSNSQIVIPRNLLLADIDVDGASDFVQYASNKLLASKTDFEKTGILHLYMHRPIKRVLTGDFYGLGYDQVCIITDDNELACFGTSPDRRELWWAFTQGTFFSDNEDTIIGDFDGDGRDDILVYVRSGGPFRMYSLKGDFFFNPTPSFNQGNLEGVVGTGMQVRAGDFNADGRDDLLVVNTWGQTLYYGSVYDGAHHTFWWGFTTSSDFVHPDDQVSLARIDDNATDDVVLRNRVTGATRFFRMEWADGVLPPITNVALGQLNVTTNSLLFWGTMHGTLNENGAAYREDALVYDHGSNMFTRSDARWGVEGLTYWWAYTQHAPDNHTGWALLVSKPWLLLKCKFADVDTETGSEQFFQDLMLSDAGLAGYWRDISYGSWDLSGSTVADGWQQMVVTHAQYTVLPSRWDRAGACIDAYRGSKDGYIDVISIVNGDSDGGNDGGRVLSGTGGENITFLAHETGHTFGWDHSFDDSGRVAEPSWPSSPGDYYDYWDIMSAMNVHWFDHPQMRQSGPSMNAPYRTKHAFIPTYRILRLSPGDIQRGVRFNIAALDRPEANGPLMVRIGDNDQNYFTIEYRMKSGWDQGIPQATLLVHQVINGRSYLKTNGPPDYQAERLVGSASTFWLGGQRFTVRIHGFAAEGYTAEISVDATQNAAPEIPRVFLPLVSK